MAYVAVKGGEQAIDAAHAWLAAERRGDPAVPLLDPAAIAQQLGHAVDRVMAEGSLHDRELDGRLVVHSDRGSQYVAMRYTERLAAAGAAPSVGSAGDAYDNALAESVIGLYKAEVIHRRGPWRGFDDIEYATLEWVAWFNTQRLLAPLGYVPPAEYEEQFYRDRAAHTAAVALN